MATDPRREYYDTGVWIARMLENGRFFRPSERLFDRLNSTDAIVIVSYPTLIETVHVLRRKTVGMTDKTFGAETQFYAESKCKTVVATFIRHLSDLGKRGKLQFYAPELTLNKHHRQIMSKIITQPVRMKTGSKRYQYSSLGPADIEHAYLARRAKTSDFYTTDGSFGQLGGDPDFAHMSFNILDPGDA